MAALTPAGEALAGWSQSAASGLPGPLADAGALALFVSVLVAAWEVALLPAMLAGRSARGSRSAATRPADSPRAALFACLVALPIAFLMAGAIQLSVFLAGAWWWLTAGAVAAAAMIAVLHLAPQLLARLSGARPVTSPALVERLGALSRQIRVPIESIDQLPPGAAATATALVAGAGSSRRVFIASELVQDWTDDEIAVVVAHEFAHHAHHDLWRTLALDAGILSIGFWGADRLAREFWLTGRPVPGDLAALPFIALVVSVVWLAATPIRYAVSRRQERRADAFALRMTGGVDAFRTALRRLASSHLVEERPSILTQWLYHRHPSVAERLATADAFQKRER